MTRVEFDEQPLAAYAQLEKSSASVMLDAVDDAIDLLESGHADASARPGRSVMVYGEFR
jgi:hypothetical protein